MEKYTDLFFGYLGNGLTVCDRAQVVHGDYKVIAHIDPCGAVKYFAEDIPADVVARIEAQALAMAERFRESFLMLDKFKALDMMLDEMTPNQCLEFLEGGRLAEFGVEDAYNKYVEMVCANSKRAMPKAS